MKNIMNEKLAISESDPIRARFYDYDHFKYPWHFHSEYEIMYVKKGEGKCFIGDNIVPYRDGDIILFGSNLPHYMCSDEKYKREDNTLRTQGTIIQFEYDFMRHSVTYYPQFVKIRRLLSEAARGVKLSAHTSEMTARLLDEMPLGSGIRQITDILLLLHEMAETKSRSLLCSRRYAESLSTFTDSRIDKITSYVNSNYNKKIKLSEVASLAAMNTSAFCRFFKEKTSRSFIQYVQELRIGYACKLLLTDELTISRISSECGFETTTHFNRTFKRVTGLNPTSYKKNMLG